MPSYEIGPAEERDIALPVIQSTHVSPQTVVATATIPAPEVDGDTTEVETFLDRSFTYEVCRSYDGMVFGYYWEYDGDGRLTDANILH